ncbi:chondroitin proteoglycan 2 isoform X2 [Drosophila biarmipes]|uniref:chondroitin proteoglycan 2 isoform X2 n=1 Tax=Drosophila biarmipes TaxID=125945 RepID=UPI0007E771E2|nr:chondroitin proteoglycan 2 isoform X2 [Drosophila biarmipes]
MKLLGLIWGMFILQEQALAVLQNGFAFKTSLCEGKNGGLLPMFGTCKGYYVCADGKAVIGTCEQNTLFNPLTLHCDDPAKVDCIFEGNDKDNVDTSSAESEEDLEELIVMTDPPVTVKPMKKQRPSGQDKAPLDMTDRMCAGKKDGVMLTKKGSCQEYFVCKSRKPHLRSCSGQQHFSPTRRICMKASDAKCLVAPQETKKMDGPALTGGVCSDEKENSLAAHRSDCGKFMLCSNMMFLVMDCPAGLHFNAASSRCDYPKVAKCQTKLKETKRKSKSRKPVRKTKSRLL